MALDTVNDYIVSARRLLLDEAEPYRYPTADLVDAMNIGIMEAVRLRPDLFFKTLRTGVPASYSASALSTTVALDVRYRSALLYYVVGMAQLRDDEATQDQRAGALLAKFTAQLMSAQA